MADYSLLFVPEKKIYDANINKNMKDVLEYSNVLTGNTSTILRSSVKTLGRVYAYDTNETCVDNATLSQVKRHSIINSMPDLQEGKGILNSANSDFKKSTADIDYVVNADKFPMRCMSVQIKENDIYGKYTTNPYYIMIAEIDKLPNTLFVGGKKPDLPIVVPTIVPTTEKFVSAASLASLDNLDAGQTFFIGSLGVIGLYIYFKMSYGNSK